MVKFAVELSEAGAQLARLVEEMDAGAEVVLTRAGHPVARLVPPETLPDRVPGSARGMVVMTDDFDAPIEGFEEYT